MNKKTILFASLLLGGLPLKGTLSADAAVRDTISINQGGQFHRGDVKNIDELKTTQGNDDVVNLPHDFLIGQDWVLLMPVSDLITVMRAAMCAAD